MSSTPGDTASPGQTTPGTGTLRRRGRIIFFIVLFVLAVAGAGYYMKRQQDRAQWKRALGLLPHALSKVPLPAGSESPELRFRKACALLAKTMDVSATDMEAGLRSVAWEIEESDHPDASDLERSGTGLAVCYLHDPENPETLNRRQTVAVLLAQEDGALPDAEMELRALIIYRRALEGKDTLYLAHHHNNLAWNLWFQKRYPEAEAEARETLSMRERLAGPDADDSISSRRFLALTLHSQKKYAEEETLRRAVLAQGEQRKPAEPDPKILKKVTSSAKLSAYRAGLEKEAKDSAAKAQKHQDWDLARYRYDLAQCLYEQSKDEEAALLADAAHREFKAQQDWRYTTKVEVLQKDIRERKAKKAAP